MKSFLNRNVQIITELGRVGATLAFGCLAACGASAGEELGGANDSENNSADICDPAVESGCVQDAWGRWRRRRGSASATPTEVADSGASSTPVVDSGAPQTPSQPNDSGVVTPSLPSNGGCDPNGAIGLQAMPGFKSAVGSLATVSGAVTLNGETLSGKKFTGAIRGHGTIKDSWIAADTYIAVQNSGGAIVLEDVTIGGPATYGDLAVTAEGSGGVVMRRVRVEGYADCFRNGPFDIENSWCSTFAQSPEDHNDGYQAYKADENKISIRCSQIDNLKAHPNAGIFHADGSQESFDLLNLKIQVDGNYCVRLHGAAKYNELPSGDTVDNGRVLRMQNIECSGGTGGVWVELPVDSWSNVTWNGKSISKP